MDVLNSGIALYDKITQSPHCRRCVSTYSKRYKEASLWTVDTGCLVFTSLIIYYLNFLSTREGNSWDTAVTFLFVLGALAYFGLSSFFRKLNRLSEDNLVVQFLKTGNKYFFFGLSFLPGLYFAFQYDEFIFHFYRIIHLVTSAYFFKKRLQEFELVPFLIGLLMSFSLGSIGPSIRIFFSIFGSGWFLTFLATLLETIVDTALALAFILRLPEKYLPPTMMFGFKVVKYLMFLFSWKTFFILMVFMSWKNIGTGAETLVELYSSSSEIKDNDTSSSNKLKSK